VETLITFPEVQTHADILPEIRARLGINNLLLRLSVGIEDVDDLIGDLAQAFEYGESAMKFGTRIIHNGHEVEPHTKALGVPIHQVSTFQQDSVDHFGKYDYARSGNPTREALEETIAQLENGTRGFAFASGMAAISSVLLLFSPGDHLVVCEDVYGGTYRVLTSFSPGSVLLRVLSIRPIWLKYGKQSGRIPGASIWKPPPIRC
jgi:cystathionine beta-lyase/cystathionine gamma-synthase